MPTLTIGLTGGVASGKTFVAARFMALGVPLLEADDVARAVVAPGQPALEEIARHFGAQVMLPDGTLNRRVLRETIFGDPAARRALEAITHPAIRTAVNTWRTAQTAPYCIYAAALLIEAGMRAQVDRLLVVDAPEAEQRRRLMARDQTDEILAQRMLEAQAPRTLRLSLADDVIDNADVARDPTPQILRLHHAYRVLSGQA